MIKINEINNLPENTGCYLFKDEKENVIYVGKAKNIKKRVSSYFHKNLNDIKTNLLISNIKFIDFIITNNEFEALTLENNLIKKFYPKYNIDLKESRRYAYFLLHNDIIPWVEIVRKREENGEYYGPFIYSSIRKTILEIIERNFKVFTKRPSKKYLKIIDIEDYKQRIKYVKLILKGKVDEIIIKLEEEMKNYSKLNRFEFAQKIKFQIFALKSLKKKNKIWN